MKRVKLSDYSIIIALLGLMLISSKINSKEVVNKENRLEKLMDLTNREIKSIQNNRYISAELKHRLFELYTERMRLMREKETAQMLKEDSSSVLKNGKDFYFSESIKQFHATQKYGLKTIEEYPKYEKHAEIFYTLAINSRDLSDNSETEKYLKLSIQNSKEQSRIKHNAKTSLAEYYYNEKKYHDAVSYYEDVLKNKNDEWYGKHLYNASWCHLKERNFSRALSLIKESFETTKEKKYVSMREQVVNAIGIFFVQADRTAEGIQFIERNINPASTYLIMLAQSSMNKNNFSTTEEVLRAALRSAENSKNPNMVMKVRLAQLDIYRENKKDDHFFNTANSILDLNKKNKIDQADVLISINKIKDVAGFMQVNLVKDKTKEVVSFNKDDYKKIIRYFDILSSLDPKEKHQYRFYQGETALSTRDFHTAMKFYIRSIMTAKKLKNKGDQTKKSIDALISTLELANINKKVEDEYTIFAFKNYLVNYPVSDKSEVIYQKLFNKYFESKKIKKATNILLVYKLNYKSSEKIHREMLTQILDHYIKNKNTDAIAFWIKHIEKGYLSFNKDYIENAIAVLGGLLFDRYQEKEKKGQLKEAMAGYESIFDSKLYPNRIKAEAAFAISVILLDQNQAKKSYKWLNESLAIFDDTNLKKLTPQLYTMSKNYRLLQQFEITKDLTSKISKRFCQEMFAEKDGMFELLSTTTYLDKVQLNTTLSLESDFKDCRLSDRIVKRLRTDALEMIIANDQFPIAKEFFLSLEQTDQSKRLMQKYATQKFFSNPDLYLKDLIDLNKIEAEFKFDNIISHFEEIKSFKNKLTTVEFHFTAQEKFNAEIYNSELEQYLSMVNDFTKEAAVLSKESTPEEIIIIRDVLSVPYVNLNKAILAYIPKGVDNKYLDGFKKGMSQISESLIAKSLQLDREKSAFIEKNNYFFEIQKHAKVEKTNWEANSIFTHNALPFVNTMDISVALNNNNKAAKGQR